MRGVLDDGTISGIGMNSMNHYAYGSVLEWMFRHAAGINTTDTSSVTLYRIEDRMRAKTSLYLIWIVVKMRESC